MDQSVGYGLFILDKATELWGHNIIEFDIPALKKLYGWKPPAGCKIRDTQVCASVIWTDIEEMDYKLVKANRMPARLIGYYSLEAFGFRLGVLKGTYGKTADWSKWTPEMQSYCEQDVEVTEALVRKIIAQNYSEECIQLEHDFAETVAADMCRRGVCFDETSAASLFAQLSQRVADLEAELKRSFPPKVVEYVTPKKQIKKTKIIEFNPTSRPQVAERLQGMGWVPTEFTDGGSVRVDDEVLATIDIPEAKPLAELFMLDKRLGYLATGKNSLLKYVKAGRLHGRVITNGAVTGRCTHSSPNLGQVPRVGSPYGAEFRSLFVASPGFVLVGADASGLELRCMAHYLAPYDGGAYIKLVTEGDVHTFNQGVFGLPPGKHGRNCSKTGIYCLVYGGGDETLGAALVLLDTEHEQAAMLLELDDSEYRRLRKAGPVNARRLANYKRGKYARARIRKHLTGYAKLVDTLAEVVFGPVTYVSQSGFKKRSGGRGYIIGLDGRRLKARSEHAILNTLFQSAGALLVKKATVLWDRKMTAMGYVRGVDYGLVLHVHDEKQSESRPEIAEINGKTFVESIAEAGRVWNFRCPLTGEYKVGKNWAETH